MSRIHEALKRAEQERAAALEGRGDVAAPPDPVAPDPLASVIAANAIANFNEPKASRTAVATPPPAPAPNFQATLDWDMVLARSAQARWNPDSKTMLFFNQDENARGTEQFRTLRSRFYHMREKFPLKKVLVTSALPKEGKSFVAANLAQVLARQHGRRVLLIDGDLRAPRLQSALGTTSTPGLGDYLLGESDEVSIMQKGPMDGLFFMPCGRTVEHPAELIANGRLKVLMQRLEPLFDWIVLDSPPAVPVSDASQLAGFCDGVLLVVRSNATPYDSAQRARREFQGKTIVGVVLNGVPRNGSYARYYYDVYERPSQAKA
jgi:protein-tyrosine kinase